jgi:hypothetical protein
MPSTGGTLCYTPRLKIFFRLRFGWFGVEFFFLSPRRPGELGGAGEADQKTTALRGNPVDPPPGTNTPIVPFSWILF